MQEQKNKRLAVLFLGLCCATAVVYFTTKGEGGVEVDKTMFKDFDLKTVNQIKLESKNGVVELKFNGTRWRVNDKYDANPEKIEVLFGTIQQAEPSRPLPASLQDSVAAYLRENGVKVSVASPEKTETVFYCGGNPGKTQAYFYSESGDQKTYLMTIPGYRVYVSGTFEQPEKDWRVKYVFGFNWRNFQSLETRFPQKPADDFQVALKDDYFGIQGLDVVDTAKLNTYLDDVSLLQVDEYVDENTFTDSLASISPLMTLIVKDIGQRTYTLALFRPAHPAQMVPGRIDSVTWAFFDPRKIQNVAKTKSFFKK